MESYSAAAERVWNVMRVTDLQPSPGRRHLQRVLDELAIPSSDMPAVESFVGGAQAAAAIRPHPDNQDPETQTAWSVACDLGRYLCSTRPQAMRSALGFACVP